LYQPPIEIGGYFRHKFEGCVKLRFSIPPVMALVAVTGSFV